MKGDATNFAREDYVEEAWRIVDPVLGRSGPRSRIPAEHMGPSETDKVLSPPDGWVDPVPCEQ